MKLREIILIALGAVVALAAAIAWHSRRADNAIMAALEARDAVWSQSFADYNAAMDARSKQAAADLMRKDTAIQAQQDLLVAKIQEKDREIEAHRLAVPLSGDCSRCRVPAQRLQAVQSFSGPGATLAGAGRGPAQNASAVAPTTPANALPARK